MREISVASLREEVFRVHGAVALTRVYHFSGVKLHDAGSPLTAAEVRALESHAPVRQSYSHACQGQTIIDPCSAPWPNGPPAWGQIPSSTWISPSLLQTA